MNSINFYDFKLLLMEFFFLIILCILFLRYRFDAELSAAQEEIKKERILREKFSREKDHAVHEKYSLEQDLQVYICFNYYCHVIYCIFSIIIIFEFYFLTIIFVE